MPYPGKALIKINAFFHRYMTSITLKPVSANCLKSAVQAHTVIVKTSTVIWTKANGSIRCLFELFPSVIFFPVPFHQRLISLLHAISIVVFDQYLKTPCLLHLLVSFFGGNSIGYFRFVFYLI